MRIAVEGITKRFGDVVAVDAVDLAIGEGELFTLVGPSGCGKSTLLRLIAGFAAPEAGTVRFGGRVMNAVPASERGIGMVFQNYALWPHMSVFENVAYGLRLRRVDPRAIATRVAEVMGKVGLTGLESRAPGQLSGGQQQRVALARALVLDPAILLLDEPLSNLDAKIRVQVRTGIRTLQQRLGITTVYVTHDQEEALALSDRLAVMDRGRVQQVGTPQAVYERPITPFVADFIGTNNLIDGVARATGQDGLTGIDTAVGTIHARAAAPLHAGTRCTVCVRPEHLALGEDASGLTNRVRGRIALGAYLGSLWRYDVEVAGTCTFKVDVRDPRGHAALRAGTEVVVGFHADAAHVIAGGPA